METILTAPILQWFAENNFWIQIISMVCGVTYMLLQIFQHKWMWYFSIATSTAAVIVASTNLETGEWAPLWAQVALNVYLICVAIAGIINWRKLDGESGGKLHVVPFKRRSLIIALVNIAVLTPVLTWVLKSFTSDPSPLLDAASLVFSIVAAWMLARSHKEQYLFWIAANLLIIAVYAGQSKWFMVAMYSFYIVTCILGYINWSKNGVVVEE